MNKKQILILGGCVAALGGLFWYLKNKKKGKSIIPASSASTSVSDADLQQFLNGTWNLVAKVGEQVYANDDYVVVDDKVYYKGILTFRIEKQEFDSKTQKLTWGWVRDTGSSVEVLADKILTLNAAKKTMTGTEGDQLKEVFTKKSDNTDPSKA